MNFSLGFHIKIVPYEKDRVSPSASKFDGEGIQITLRIFLSLQIVILITIE